MSDYSGLPTDIVGGDERFEPEDHAAHHNLVHTLPGEVTVIVAHGTNATHARPSGVGRVEWIGTVAPENAADGDIWTDSESPSVPTTLSHNDLEDLTAGNPHTQYATTEALENATDGLVDKAGDTMTGTLVIGNNGAIEPRLATNSRTHSDPFSEYPEGYTFMEWSINDATWPGINRGLVHTWNRGETPVTQQMFIDRGTPVRVFVRRLATAATWTSWTELS